jgi:hypothetical protein
MEDHPTPAPRPARSISVRAAVATAVVAAVLGGALVARAGGAGPFPDVPADHVFATEIERLAGAGITSGFSDGSFRPGQSVTRQSMAAFLNRGLGRIAHASWSGVTGAVDGDEILSDIGVPISIRAGATGDGNGFLQISAEVEVFTNLDTCPCALFVQVVGTREGAPSSEFFGPQRTLQLAAGERFGHMSVTSVFPVNADEAWSFEMVARVDSTTSAGTAAQRTQISGSLTAAYVPFGFDGGNSLGI